MFSTTQMTFIENTVMNMYLQGYEYYIVHTNTNLSSSYYQWQDLTLYFSKEPITRNSDYSYTIPNETLMYDVITSNASRNYYDDARVDITTLSSRTILINDYEFIATNCNGSRLMNVLASIEYQEQKDVSFNLDLNDFYIIPVILCITLLFSILRWWYPSSYSKGDRL